MWKVSELRENKMAYLNRFQILGRLTSSPVLRKTGDGRPVGNLRVAVNSNGSSTFLSVVVWNKMAENCMEYLVKGSLVLVEGFLQERTWDKDGDSRTTVELVANNIQFLDKKAEDKKKTE